MIFSRIRESVRHESNQRDIFRMKIVVTGTRGIPDIQGGVETHCEELFPRLARYGMDIVLIRRSCYVSPDNRINEFKGEKLEYKRFLISVFILMVFYFHKNC